MIKDKIEIEKRQDKLNLIIMKNRQLITVSILF